MDGRKGRAGRTTDPEAKRAKQIAAHKGNGGQGAGSFCNSDTPEEESLEAERMPPQVDEILSLLPGKNPYDLVVLRTKGRFSYLDGKTREQSNGELLNNERKRLEQDIERKKLLTVEAVRERDATRDDVTLSNVQILINAAISLVTPEAQPAARIAMGKAEAEFRRKVSEALKEIKY